MGLFGLHLPKKVDNVFGGVGRQLNPFDNGQTYKQQTPTGNRSVLGQLTHNGVTNVVGGAAKGVVQLPVQFAENYANTFANLGNRAAGGQNQTIQQNLGGNQLLNKTLNFSGATGKNRQLAGDVAQVGLTALAPATTKFIEPAASRLIPAAAPKIITRLAPRVASNATIGGAFGTTAAAGNGANLQQSLKAGGQTALLGGAFPIAGEVGRKSVRVAQNRAPLNDAGFAKLPSPAPSKKNGVVSVKAENSLQQGTGEGLSTEEQIANALGMSKQELANAKAESQASPLTKIPNQAGGISKVPSTMKPTVEQFRRTAQENTNLNPQKLTIGEVNPGDYEKARANYQQVGNTINVATRQAITAVNKLTPDEKVNFAHMVENPKLATSATAKEAVARHNYLTNLTHATNQALGGNTNFIPNYFRHSVDLSNPADAARWEELLKKRGGQAVDPYSFGGIDNMNRAFKSVKALQAAGFHLKNEGNPSQNILDYGKSSANSLQRQALNKGITEADMNQLLKNRNFDLRNGTVLPVSEQGLKELQTFDKTSNAGKPLKAYRKTNQEFKKTLLSVSQFHPININALQAFPAMIGTPKDWITGEGHPLRAVQGLTGSARALLDKNYTDKVIQGALQDGTIENAAKLGTPILHGNDFTASGRLPFGKSGFGERAIFERQLPVMHTRMVQGVVADLNKRGIPLDSVEARKVGTEINQIMGYVNTELKNFNPKVARGISDVALAPQFTRAKWETMRDAVTKGGLQGNLARRAVIGKYTAEAAIILTLGAILKQKSDSLKDSLYRAVLHPSVPTPFKDKKGNTIELGLPQNYISEGAGLVGDLQRNSNGRLSANLNPKNVPGNLANYGRSRLAVLPASGLKLATNTDYANKPLYNPTAPAGTKAQQAATTLTTGLLPIGLQGVPQLNVVKKHLPQGIQDVLNQSSPGSNPIAKSVGSSFGLTPRTDKTVGKGLSTQQYFDAKDKFSQSLNPAEKNLFNKIAQQQKDSFGNQIKSTSTLTKVSDYGDLIANPDFAKKYQAYQKSQPNHDPLWDLNSNQLRSYMQAQVIGKNDPGGDSTTTSALYANLPPDFFSKRDQYFSKLQSGGVKLDNSNYVARPQMPAELQAFSDNYHNLPYGTGARSSALRSATGQAYIAYLDQNRMYNNQERADLGLPPLTDPSSTYSSTSSSRSINPATYAKAISVKAAPKLARTVSVKKIAARPRGSGSSKIKVSVRKAAA